VAIARAREPTCSLAGIMSSEYETRPSLLVSNVPARNVRTLAGTSKLSGR
jgi:hypothetical protein